MRIRIVQKPPVDDLDGVNLHHFQVGTEYDISNSLASVFLAEGWAEPVPLDAPPLPQPFCPDDPFTVRVVDRSNPPNLTKEHSPPFLDHDRAADFEGRRRRRPR